MTEDSADVVVIGSGPAGMAAACEARKHKLSVILLDEQPLIGGQIYRNIENAPPERLQILGQDYAAGAALCSEFRESGTDHRDGVTVWNVTTDGAVDFVGKTGGSVKGRFVVIASGAMERPFPVRGWTLPGVMGAGAAQILLKSSGAIPSAPPILAGCGPLLYLLAWQYLRAGVQLAAVVDTTEPSAYLRSVRHVAGAVSCWRDLAKGIKLIAAIRNSRTPFYRGARDLEVLGSDGAEALTFLHRGKRREIRAPLIIMHQGVVPNNQISLSTGAEHRWNEQQLCWHPVTDAWGNIEGTSLYVAGDSRAIVGAVASEVQGRIAAKSIAHRLDVPINLEQETAPLVKRLASLTKIRPFLDTLYRPIDGHRIPANEDVHVCRCEEVTAGQIRDYVSLGCLGPNQTKSFGRCGMGPCQGRFCSLTVTEIIASERGMKPSDVGHYRVRPPIKPVLLGDLAR